MPKVEAPLERRHGRHRYVGVDLGEFSVLNFGDAGGLTQFGVFLETLHPGASSSVRHWHEHEDEFVYVLAGRPTLVEETETELAPGDAVAWPAGRPLAHCLQNRTDEDATYLVIGTRAERDRWHYPDHGITGNRDGDDTTYTGEDGTPIERETP